LFDVDRRSVSVLLRLGEKSILVDNGWINIIAGEISFAWIVFKNQDQD